jgi:ABC-type branched-subunit amino acid transport system ATPase component
MIRTLHLKFGHAPGMAPEPIELTPVTVFVGPNNSGKSKVLSEIHQFCSSGQVNAANVILGSLEIDGFDPEVAKARVEAVTLQPGFNELVQPEHVIVGKRGHRMQVPSGQLLTALVNPAAQLQQFCQWYLQYNTLILDGQNRIGLTQSQNAGDLQNAPHTSFQSLFQDDDKRAEVRRIVHDAFGSHLVVDPTNLGQLRLRLSLRSPVSSAEERGWDAAAVDFHSKALPIEQASDGVKAFTGMITEIIAGDPSVMLIDEPEAFLHPALSFKLGLEIAKVSMGSDKRLFVSTHSASFVMGCIQSGAPVNIIRLTYRNDVATARVLPNTDILRLMRNPLLRSTGVISGLFYEFVVVTESDSDRAFYQEVNERLLPDRGIPNCLFLNAQNKQTVRMIIKPLRELGIPAAGVVDIDVLKEGGAVWSDFLGCAFVPEIDKTALAGTRASVKERLEATQKDMKRDGGLALLSGADLEAANNLMDRLGEYGLFVVRNGELESWLPGLGANGHGPAWLISAFEQMGEDPEGAEYLHPTDGDVWGFVAGVATWLNDPNRKGIPA